MKHPGRVRSQDQAAAEAVPAAADDRAPLPNRRESSSQLLSSILRASSLRRQQNCREEWRKAQRGAGPARGAVAARVSTKCASKAFTAWQPSHPRSHPSQQSQASSPPAIVAVALLQHTFVVALLLQRPSILALYLVLQPHAALI